MKYQITLSFILDLSFGSDIIYFMPKTNPTITSTVVAIVNNILVKGCKSVAALSIVIGGVPEGLTNCDDSLIISVNDFALAVPTKNIATSYCQTNT